MAEPLYLPKIIAGPFLIEPKLRARDHASRQQYLLWRAAASAIEGAMRFARDMPIGAAVATGKNVTAAFFASDVRTGFADNHAELSSIRHAIRSGYAKPDTLGVTVEPCGNCQAAIACNPTINTVLFTSERKVLEELGIVTPRPGIMDELKRGKELPYEVIHFEDPYLALINDMLFATTTREPSTNNVSIDRERLAGMLLEHPAVEPSGIPLL